MQEFDYIIIGGGISGLTFARLLQLYTNKTFLVLEGNSGIGGLCRTKEVDGNYFDTGGGHFLHSKHQKVYEFIFSHIAKSEFNKFGRVTKIDIHDKLIDFPIEDNLWQLPVELQLKYIDSMFTDSSYALAYDHDNSFIQWIYKNLGSEIAENYMIPYNQKMWGDELNNLSVDWLYKLPKVDLRNIVKSILLKKANRENLPSHDYFYYPKTGGFQSIVNAIYEPIKNNVLLNFNIESINYNERLVMDNNTWTINESYKAKNIINTASGKSLDKTMLGGFYRPFFYSKLNDLKYTSLDVTFKKRHYKTDVHWTYIPNLDIDHHRLFYVNNYAVNNSDSYIALETNSDRSRFGPDNELYLTGEGNYNFHNEYAYPIPLKGKNEAMKEILDFYEKKNFHGLGRWGTWQHHNSDVCIFNAMELLNKLENKFI